MNLFPRVVGALLVLLGACWFLQGISVLPGSVVTGHLRSAVCGAVAAGVGATLLFVARGRR